MFTFSCYWLRRQFLTADTKKRLLHFLVEFLSQNYNKFTNDCGISEFTWVILSATIIYTTIKWLQPFAFKHKPQTFSRVVYVPEHDVLLFETGPLRCKNMLIRMRNPTVQLHWHILIWTACCNTCWLKACVVNWSWRIWEWLLMGYNADHTHLSSNMSHDLYSLLWFTYECLLVVAVGRILFILK